jgi:hypothetical protein
MLTELPLDYFISMALLDCFPCQHQQQDLKYCIIPIYFQKIHLIIHPMPANEQNQIN